MGKSEFSIMFFLPGTTDSEPGNEVIINSEKAFKAKFLERRSEREWELGIAANTYPDNIASFYCFRSEFGWYVNCSGYSDVSEYTLLDDNRVEEILTIERAGSVEQFNSRTFVGKEIAMKSFHYFIETGERTSELTWAKIVDLKTQDADGAQRQIEIKTKLESILRERSNRDE
jgi:hypothetical protein